VRVALSVVWIAAVGCDHLLDLPDIHPPPQATPAFERATANSAGSVASLQYPLDVPQIDNGLLVVSVMLSGKLSAGVPAPAVDSVTFAGLPLSQFDAVAGVPSDSSTLTEQWQLLAPPAGANDVIVTLSKQGLTIHSLALLFSNVDQTNPIGTPKHDKGSAITSAVTVKSNELDLVESCVGDGNSIVSPGDGQLLVVLDNGSPDFSLDNAACSVAPGVSPTVTMTWTMDAVDNWQEIAASLQPAR
jgi:hypothetical protein